MILFRISRGLLGWAGLIALWGCTLNAQQPPYIVVTSDIPIEMQAQILTETAVAVHAILPVSTPMATLAPSPTPINVMEVLQRADTLRINGRYEEALEYYEQLISASESLELRSQALFRFGQTAVREGLFNEALSVLNPLIDEQMGRSSQAYFLRAEAHLGLGEWQRAITDFELYLQLRPTVVDSYVYERIGDAYLALNQLEVAMQSYERAINSPRGVVPHFALREKVAQLYTNQGKIEQAVSQYDAILASAQNTGYRASIERRVAENLLQANLLELALQRFVRVFSEYTTTPDAYQAMQVLEANGQTLNALQKGKVAFYYGDYLLAIQSFNAYSTQVTLAEVPSEMHLLLGRAYREIGNPSAAMVAFQTIIDQYPQDDLFGEALLEQGRTSFLAGDVNSAINRYLTIAQTYSYLGNTAAEALWRAAYLYGTNGQLALSVQTFESLAQQFPQTEQAITGLLIGASSAYSAQDYATAERLYAQVASTTTGEDQATAYYWLGQLALQKGNMSGATQAFQLASQADADTYFASRALDIATQTMPFQRPSAYEFELDEANALVEAETWLRATFQPTSTDALHILPNALANQANLTRATELWEIGLYDEATEEFFELVESVEGDGVASYQVALYLRGVDAYYPSIFAAANVIKLAGVSTLDAPRLIAQMRYPVYYLASVQEIAQRWNIDPLLVFALIRQESLFNTYATAAAGEVGLMQVIPPTSEYIAQQLGWQNYQHSQLFRPHVGIQFGSYYLQEQLATFNGNVIAALSAYNAGPGRALDWMELSGGDPDLFMTTITIDSTRQYVQLIYRNYAIYRSLYGA